MRTQLKCLVSLCSLWLALSVLLVYSRVPQSHFVKHHIPNLLKMCPTLLLLRVWGKCVPLPFLELFRFLGDSDHVVLLFPVVEFVYGKLNFLAGILGGGNVPSVGLELRSCSSVQIFIRKLTFSLAEVTF